MRLAALFLFGMVALPAVAACGRAGASMPEPARVSPGSLAFSPSTVTLSVSGANGIPQSVPIVLHQSGVATEPNVADGTSTCLSLPSERSDVLKLGESGGPGFTPATATYTATQELIAQTPGTCTLTVTVNSSTATLTATVYP